MSKSVRPPSEQPDNQKPQPAQPDRQKQIERYIAYFCGVIFVLIMLALALFVPNPTSFQLFVFRVVLALAAAGIASMTPGFLEVKVSEVIRAGGALAIFVIVYMFNPAAQVVDENPPAAQVVEGSRSASRSDIEGLLRDVGALVVKWERIDDDNELPCQLIHGKADQLGDSFHNIRDEDLGKFLGEKIAKYQYSQLAYLIASDVECNEALAIQYAQQSLTDGREALYIIEEVEDIPGSSGQALRTWIDNSYIRGYVLYHSALGYAVLDRYGDMQASQNVSKMLSDINIRYYEEQGVEPEKNRLLAPIISSTSTDNQSSSHPCPSACGFS